MFFGIPLFRQKCQYSIWNFAHCQYEMDTTTFWLLHIDQEEEEEEEQQQQQQEEGRSAHKIFKPRFSQSQVQA